MMLHGIQVGESCDGNAVLVRVTECWSTVGQTLRGWQVDFVHAPVTECRVNGWHDAPRQACAIPVTECRGNGWHYAPRQACAIPATECRGNFAEATSIDRVVNEFLFRQSCFDRILSDVPLKLSKMFEIANQVVKALRLPELT